MNLERSRSQGTLQGQTSLHVLIGICTCLSLKVAIVMWGGWVQTGETVMGICLLHDREPLQG